MVQGGQQVFGTSEEHGESVRSVEVIRGEASEEVEGGDGESLDVVDDQNGMWAVVLLEGGQIPLGVVEQVGGVLTHGEADEAAQGAEETRLSRRQVGECDDVKAVFVESTNKAPHGDGLAHATLTDDEGDAAELGPHL